MKLNKVSRPNYEPKEKKKKETNTRLTYSKRCSRVFLIPLKKGQKRYTKLGMLVLLLLNIYLSHKMERKIRR